MRTIKFRIWSKVANKMSPAESFSSWCYAEHNSELNSLDDKYVEIMQYTGLKDKNGKEIYEGDVVKLKVGQGIVRWFEKDAMFGVETLNHSLGTYCVQEVLGNIYENPELLTN